MLRRSDLPRLLRELARARRTWLLVRLKLAAFLQLATVDVDIDPTARIGRRIEISVGRRTKTRLSVGPRASLGYGVQLRLRGGELSVGADVEVRSHVVLNVGGGRLVLEGPNILGWGVVVHCAEHVHFARRAYVAEYATIVDSSHYYSNPDEWSYHNTRTAPVEIGEEVWVCPKATITSGVTIGHHTVVASNTVVVKDTPPGVLVSGVPARIVRELDLPWVTRDDR